MTRALYPITSREAKKKGRDKALRDLRDHARRIMATQEKETTLAAMRIALYATDTPEKLVAQLEYLEAQSAYDAACGVKEWCDREMGKLVKT